MARSSEQFSASTIIESEQPSLKMVSGAFYISKAKASNPQGDDAYFINGEKQTIGVADGVGGWSKKGVDAGEYARKLMFNAANAINNLADCDIDPKQVLKEAYSKTHEDGSSTACILTLKHDLLHAVNVGDSGFLLIREGQEDMFKSPTQQSSFNAPYQLGRTSGEPSLAQEFNIAVKPGEVIVVGTDGLFDNLFPNQIKEVVKLITESGGEPEQAAWALAEHAYHNSTDATAHTPYTQSSSLAGGQHTGGKKDDITAIVAYIVDSPDLIVSGLEP